MIIFKEVRELIKTARKATRGFTLVELLVVIAIVAILAAVVVLIINPLELTRRGRDAARLSDLSNLQNAINVAVQEATSSGQNMACAGAAGSCTDKSSDTGDTTNQKTDGTGWVKVNFGVQSSITIPTLPVDPTNNAANHYTYCGNGDDWVIVTDLESTQQSPKEVSDGGVSTTLYEVGSKLTACTY